MIETTRLLLRPMRAEDVDDLLRVFADPKVMASFGGVLFDRDDMARWVGRNLEHQARYGYGLFSVVHKADGLLIGDCGLERLDAGGAPETELGYDLRSDHWGRGLATEAAAAVRDHAFYKLNLPRLISLIRHGNAASRRVAEKIGMRHAADVTRDGRDYRLYALDRAGETRPPSG
jgi:ribosomal-protein-alanine N-acetyltransferase